VSEQTILDRIDDARKQIEGLSDQVGRLSGILANFDGLLRKISADQGKLEQILLACCPHHENHPDNTVQE